MKPSDLQDKPLMLTLGGVERPFRYSFASYALLTERYESVEEPFENLSRLVRSWFPGAEPLRMDRVMVASLVDCVHAGLIPSDPAITRDEVANLLDMTQAIAAILVIVKARGVSLPEVSAKAAEADPPRA